MRSQFKNPQLVQTKVIYPLFESVEVVLGQCVGFGEDRDQVDASPKALHDLDVERFESGHVKCVSVKVKCRR